MASGVFLHVGQCGVQLGRSFWDTMLELAQATAGTTRKSQLIKNSSSTSTMPLAVCEDVLPCVVVDSEPRPAHSCFGHRVSPHKLFPDVLVTDKPGRGNNWAFGYNGRTPKSKGCDHELVEKVRDAVRRMAEECSCFLGVIIFHSIAGGTGSGLTSRLVEILRDDYPHQYILCVSVAPFLSGESPTQNYNSLLCLYWLQCYTDCILLVQNDVVMQHTIQHMALSTTTSKYNSMSLVDINRFLSLCLCNCLMPLGGDDAKRFSHRVAMEPWELSQSLCPDPALKIITPSHITITQLSSSWEAVLSHLLQDRKVYDVCCTGRIKQDVKAQSALLVARGSPFSLQNLTGNLQTVEKKISHTYNTVKWNPFPVDVWLKSEPSSSNNKNMSLLVNSSQIASYLDSVCCKSWLKYCHNAYWHWYEQYGLDKETFEQAYEGVQTVINSYKHM